MPGMDFSSTATVTKGKGTEKRRVGFYGCAGQVIRLEDPGRAYPRSLRVDCPGCGHNHVVKLAWRPWVESLDEDKEAIQIESSTP